MSDNARVAVKNGDVEKTLRTLEKRLRKSGLWEYDPDRRPYSGGKKVRKRGKKKAP
ncbi:MAG: hypothetical protein PHR36_02210 [Patescibacteria group bacterium]|nr:hypothetical protein [Patescibacteria group bacterium]